MKASALFKQYVWLVGTISRAGRITLREINERWLRTEMSEGVEFSRTTFRRHRAEVEEMRESRCLSIRYRRYGKTESSQWTVEPYCIKLFRRRWYLLGRLEGGAFLTLSFDRIQEMAMTDRTFVLDKDFDAQSYFSAYYGIMQGGDEPKQRIVLRAYGNERYAMRDLPLHHSQKELGVGEDYVDFEVKLHPTSDFLAQILSRGRWLKVLEPEDIALKIKRMHLEAAED